MSDCEFYCRCPKCAEYIKTIDPFDLKGLSWIDDYDIDDDLYDKIWDEDKQTIENAVNILFANRFVICQEEKIDLKSILTFLKENLKAPIFVWGTFQPQPFSWSNKEYGRLAYIDSGLHSILNAYKLINTRIGPYFNGGAEEVTWVILSEIGEKLLEKLNA